MCMLSFSSAMHLGQDYNSLNTMIMIDLAKLLSDGEQTDIYSMFSVPGNILSMVKP